MGREVEEIASGGIDNDKPVGAGAAMMFPGDHEESSPGLSRMPVGAQPFFIRKPFTRIEAK